MKQSLAFAVATWILLILSSCKEVSFPVAQPRGVQALTEVPVALRGSYLAGDSAEDKKDTLFIEQWGYHFKDSREKDWLGKGVISDSLVIKHHKNYYFINFRSGDQWVLRIVQQQPDGDLNFMSFNMGTEEAEKSMIDKLSKKMDVKKFELEDGTFYQINPSANQLMSLIKEGYFTTIELERKK
jgi:hypothetical protein